MSGKAVIIDNGSFLMKAGFAGEDKPTSIFRNVIGSPKFHGFGSTGSTYIGDDALSKRGILNLRYPMEYGQMRGDDMETIWQYIFDQELKLLPQDHPVLMTESPLELKDQRETMAHILFEKFKIPALYIGNQAVLALAAQGQTTGLVIESGESGSYIVPIQNGKSIPAAVLRLDIGGRDITQLLTIFISPINNMVGIDQEIMINVKERFGYVALDFEAEIKKFSSTNVAKTYELPSGEVSNLGDGIFRSPEALFQPLIAGKEFPGLHQVINESVMMLEAGLRKEMYSNILLSGGNTMFPGLAERLEKEMKFLAGSSTVVKITAPSQRNLDSWRGGSMLAAQPNFPQMWVSRQDYEEKGPSVIHSLLN